MTTNPADLRYHAGHTWARTEDDGHVRVGITDHAQDELDTVVYVDLPQPDSRVEQGQPFGEIESTKTVRDLIAPVSGTVVARNDALQDDPERVNRDPYGQGWMILIDIDDPDQLDGLLTAQEYRDTTRTG
ncbi:glycine cleavage system protein GcvH [Euzebya sp.]|uniref:glycine cleavage system protein GcvH n=1 Tax=Euzebya sp. TaxID=1971409 RepID=UPI003517EC88